MRKITAHYYLKQDGTFGKRPVVHLGDDGYILKVRELGEHFSEEPNLEYFPGILIPGFVASIESKRLTDLKNKCLVNGVIRLKIDNDELDVEFLEAWSSVKQTMSNQTGEKELGSCLRKYTYLAAQAIGESEWGVIKEGARPGLLILQNIDLRDFSLSERLTFKMVQK